MKITVSAVAVWLAFAAGQDAPAPQPSPAKCCADCGGTGMVWTGDKVARVHCPCPPTCPCAKNRPRMTCTGPNCVKEIQR